MKPFIPNSLQVPITTTLEEVHIYIEDMRRITILRDKAHTKEDRDYYDNQIKCMQYVLNFLNKLLAESLEKAK